MTPIGSSPGFTSAQQLVDALRALGALTARLPRLLLEAVTGPAAGHSLRLALAAAALGVACWALRRRRADRLCRDGRYIAVLAPPEVEADGAAALWTNLHDLQRPGWRRAIGDQLHVGFEYTWTPAGLAIGLWTPRALPPGLVERAVEAAWPAAVTTTTEPAPPPLPLDARCLGGRLRLAAPEHYPLRVDHPSDPLRQVIGGVGVPGEGAAAVVQILARPATGRRTARSLRAAHARRTGRSSAPAARLLDLATPGGPPPPRPAAEDPTRAADIRAILDKAAHPGWEIDIRYAVAAAADKAAGQRLRGRAHALASAFALYASGRNRLARRRLRRPARALAARRLRRGDLVSVPELAALAHLPTDPTVAGLDRAGAKAVAAPLAIRPAGKVLGDTQVGVRRPVALGVADARYHTHLLGATGCGKSTLLANLILGDVAAGRGVVAIDPKGDLITDLLDRLPAEAAERVVLLDPDDADAPPSLNMLEGENPELVVDHLVGIFRRIFAHFWGPRTDDVLRAACLTLMHTGNATLARVPALLANAALRHRHTARLADPVLKGFWTWYEQLGEAEQGRVVGPVMNKLRVFLLRRFVRDVVGSTASSFDMGDILDGGVCLVRIPKGLLGEDTARLLGSFVVAKTWQAATARAAQPEGTRRDAALYIDEAQNFLNLPHSLGDMLAEARGYRLALTLAHQNLAQLPRELGYALSANARNKIYFAASPEDASVLERHVAPHLSRHDLSHLDAHQAAARLLADGAEQPPFTLRTRPAPPPVPGRAQTIRATARARYGRTLEQRRSAAHRRTGEDPRDAPDTPPVGGSASGWPGGSTSGPRPARDPRSEPAAQPPARPAHGSRDSSS